MAQRKQYQKIQSFSEYFGEMDIDEEQKKERTSLAESIKKTVGYIFTAIAVLKFLDRLLDREELLDSLLTRVKDDIRDNGIKLDDYPELETYIDNRFADILDLTIENLDKEDDDFNLSEDRKDLIAVNESNSVYNNKEFADAIKKGYTHKTWVTMMDSRVRHTHEIVNGERIGIYDLFSVGESAMAYPRDFSHDASMDEIANCRCCVKYSR